MYKIKVWLWLYLLPLTLILTGCREAAVGEGPWVKKIESEEISRLVINFSKKMKSEQHLELEDSRVEYNDFIKKIYLEYSCQRLLTVYEARLMIVELVEDFLDRLNNHTFLSFELQNFPFTADDIEVKINFESFYGRYIDELYVGLTWLKCGCVYFYAFDIKDQIGDIDWSHDRWEPYFKSKELALLKKEADMADMEVQEGLERRRRGVLSSQRYQPLGP